MQSALAAAEAQCAARNLRLTPVRRRVLEILCAQHRAMGAYAILSQLRAEGFGSQPPVAYRALEFLVGQGLVHRVERLNAFIACGLPGEPHAPALMICRLCDAVAETADPGGGRLGQAADDLGFRIESTVVEAQGVCPSCSPQSSVP